MPTDFSFVSDEGWDALKPQFERAEQKLKDKVRKKEITEDQARRLTDLMWKKYDHWAEGKGMKEKENQTVLQQKPTKKAAAMSREARIGRTQLVDILNAIFSDEAIQNSAVFQQTLELNKITEQEFFDLLAKDVAAYPQLYPRQYVSHMVEHFTDWGYEPEARKVIEQARGAVGPKPPASYDRPAPPTPQPAQGQPPPLPPAAQPAAPAPESGARGQFKVEPRPWPQNLQPTPSKNGPAFRWYALYRLPGENEDHASVAEGLNRDDALALIGKIQNQKITLKQMKQLNEVPVQGRQQAPAPAKAPPAPKPSTTSAPPTQVTDEEQETIERPDPSDPVKYVWLIKFKSKGGRIVQHVPPPQLTGSEAAAVLKWYEKSGMPIIAFQKIGIGGESKGASFMIDDRDIRLAADGEPQEKFRNGTPIIFTEDVNLEFDALSARGQIKKNMTGKIKKVEDNDYLIDIAGQLYRVPRLVAEHVMDVFAANVVSDEELDQQMQAPGQQPGQDQAQQPAPPPEKAQAPVAKPQAQAPGQNQGQLPPGGAPKMPAGMAGIISRIIVAETDGDEGEFFAEMGMDADAKTQYMRERNPCDVCPHMSSAHDFSDGGNYACQLCAQEGGPCATGYQPKDTDTTEYREQAGPARDVVDPHANPGGAIGNPMAMSNDRMVVADIEVEAMAMSNGTLAKRFVGGATSGKGSHMFIDGDTIYSYGRHFPVATRSGGNTFWLTDKRYSVSTARHISEVRNAIIRAGYSYVLSDRFENGKVAEPTPEEIQAREQAEAAAQAKRDKLDEKRLLRDQKKITQKRQMIPDERAHGIAETENKNLDDKAYIEQHDERGRPIKYRVDRTLAPSTLEETPSLTPEQWMSRIQDIEDQLLRETDPGRQEKLRQRMERMKQAAFTQAMRRVAGTENPKGGEKADFDDLHKLLKEQDKNTIRGKDTNLKVENKRPQTAAVQSQGFSDLLMLIEKGGPGIPSEIGKRLYRADGAVARVSA